MESSSTLHSWTGPWNLGPQTHPHYCIAWWPTNSLGRRQSLRTHLRGRRWKLRFIKGDWTGHNTGICSEDLMTRDTQKWWKSLLAEASKLGSSLCRINRLIWGKWFHVCKPPLAPLWNGSPFTHVFRFSQGLYNDIKACDAGEMASIQQIAVRIIIL